MSEHVKPYQDEGSKKEQVADMFNNIAHRYDFLNHLLSAGIDRGWRRKARKLLAKRNPKQILDIATGTGDFAIELTKLNPKGIVGVDIAASMLDKGREKIADKHLSGVISFEVGDSEKLRFANGSFDAITVAFGVRNFENLRKGLKEMNRVLNHGGMVVVLEFSKPRNVIFKGIYLFYFKRILPLLGRVLSKDPRAYTYLPESVEAFPDGQDFIDILQSQGFRECRQYLLTLGIASIYTGVKYSTSDSVS